MKSQGSMNILLLCLKFIADNSIEISGKEEVTIPILFDFQGLGVEVRIPSWEEIGVKPEW